MARFQRCRFEIAGTALAADGAGVLVIEDEQVLVVADLHLEKGSSLARRGALLPPYDTRATLQRLHTAIDRIAPRVVVALGDSFHDGGGGGRLSEGDRALLLSLQRGRQWLWIMGNHDPVARRDLGGEWQQDWCCRGLVLRHDPVLAATGEVAGHLHPCARVVRNGLSQRRPCFVFNSQRVILPAFGAYAGGLNVLAPAASRLFADQPSVAVVGRSGIYLVATEQLRPD